MAAGLKRQSPRRTNGAITIDAPALVALGATSAASALAAGRDVRVVPIARPAAGADRDRNALHHAAVVMARRVHAVVDGEVATDEIRPHGGALPRQGLVLADNVRLVLAVVDAHSARVSGRAVVQFVQRFWPAPASAETYTTWLLAYTFWAKMLDPPIDLLSRWLGFDVPSRSAASRDCLANQCRQHRSDKEIPDE